MAQGGEMNDVGRDTALALRAIVAYENGVLRRLTVRAGLCYVLAKYSVYATLAALADAFAQVWSDGMLAIRGVLRTDVEGVFESAKRLIIRRPMAIIIRSSWGNSSQHIESMPNGKIRHA